MDNEDQKLTNKKILIVEDDIDTRSLIKLFLETNGYNTSVANDGKEALEQLRTTTAPCLILSDLIMPNINGWELIDIISNDKALNSIPIIVLSAYGGVGEQGDRECINKPVDLNLMLKTVIKHCGSC